MYKKIIFILLIILISGCFSEKEKTQKRYIIKDSNSGKVTNIYEYENNTLKLKEYKGNKFLSPNISTYKYNKDGYLSEVIVTNEKLGTNKVINYEYEKVFNNTNILESIKRVSSEDEEVVYHIGYNQEEMVGIVEENIKEGTIFSKSFE